MATRKKTSGAVTFTAESASLVLQDAARFSDPDLYPFGVWAAFEDGEFTTDDPAVIEALDAADGVTRKDEGAAGDDAPDA